MKKTFLAAVAMSMLATSASALSFSWASSVLSFDGTALRNNTSVTGYLVYLGSGVSTLESSYATDSLPSAIGTQVDTKTKTSAASKITQTFSFDYGSYSNGDSFALVLSYNDGTDTYYNISSSVYTISGISDETSALDQANFSFSNSTSSPSATTTTGGGWTAVPEPSTAMLALAGLALLIKRRRA